MDLKVDPCCWSRPWKVAMAAAAPAMCPLLGDNITDDTLLHIASFIPTAKDLLCLWLSNRRFSIKCIAAQSGGAAAAPPEMLCIAEEAGRLWVAGCTEQERGWVPRSELESWLGLMQEVGVLQQPLLFGRRHSSLTKFGDIPFSDSVATKRHDGSWRSAASKVVMRSGRHFAQFTLVNGDNMFFGVTRPGWDVEGGATAWVEDSCFYDTRSGDRYPGQVNWEGKQTAREQGDRIGMLLDLDQGSMTVWKNDVKLGVMVAKGLSGPLCWAVSLYHQGYRARIESAPAPLSPTKEELAAAKAWVHAEDGSDEDSDDG